MPNRAFNVPTLLYTHLTSQTINPTKLHKGIMNLALNKKIIQIENHPINRATNETVGFRVRY